MINSPPLRPPFVIGIPGWSWNFNRYVSTMLVIENVTTIVSQDVSAGGHPVVAQGRTEQRPPRLRSSRGGGGVGGGASRRLLRLT